MPTRGKYSAVLIDNQSGAYEAVTHLISKGHTKIAFLGADMAHPSMCERLIGYIKALEDHELPVEQNVIIDNEKETAFNNGYRATECLLNNNQKPTAIFACNDAMAIGCIKYLHEKNIKIPNDMSIVGFDDIEQDIQIVPHLTTVRVFKEEMGAVAVRRMVEMLESRNYLAGTALIPVELVVRESTQEVSNNH